MGGYTPEELKDMAQEIADVITKQTKKPEVIFGTFCAHNMRNYVEWNNLIEVDVEMRCIGRLGMPYKHKNIVILNPSMTSVKEQMQYEVDNIREKLSKSFDFPCIGRIRHQLDPVLASILRSDVDFGLNLINKGSMTAGDYGRLCNHVVRADQDEWNDVWDMRMQVCLEIAPGVRWAGERQGIAFEKKIPETMRSAIIGRPLSDIVIHKHLPPNLIVTGIEDFNRETILKVCFNYEPLSGFDGLWPPAGMPDRQWLNGMPIEFETI